MSSALVISLDFELYWGLRDVVPLESYRNNLLGVREAIPAMLDLFAKRGIHATWATVGMLFCSSKRELEALCPSRLPKYDDASLSPYDLSAVGDDERSDPFHFAPSLIQRIATTPGQEVGSHTFSHFYCLEPGPVEADFDADLDSAQKAAARLGVTLRSLVFPRNQHNPRYVKTLAARGLRTYRSSGRWPYAPGRAAESRATRGVRLLDSYVPVAGERGFAPPRPDALGLSDVPASAFLRPYSRRLRALEPLKIRRLTHAMTRAAKRGELFHLWWHPHNFGINLRENMANLSAVLDCFEALRRDHGMQSLSMIEASQ